MKSAVAYVRVSSNSQEQEGFSIPAQIELVTNYAERKSIYIEKIFEEPLTAGKYGRKAFNQMLAYCTEHNIKDVLVEKTDRVYRNFKDYVMLEDYDLNLHLVKENQIINKNSSSHEKFIHAMKVVIAKNFLDNLSEEIRKGLKQKVSQGYFPGKAPVGYKNVEINKRNVIVVDDEKAPFVQRLFELYASGLSVSEARKILYAEGLYHNNKPYAKSRLLQILHDCFYIGKFLYKGVVYDGVHEPIIDIRLYNKVQKMFNQSKARTHDVEFPYTGIIRCGHCGCQLTAELKKGKYIYYHCTGKRGGTCKKDYIREEKFDKLVMSLLEKIAVAIPDEIYPKAVEAIKEMNNVGLNYTNNSIDQITKKLKNLTKRINSLYEDKIDGVITQEFWEEKNRAWSEEKYKLQIQLESLSKTSDRFYEGSNLLLNFCKDAPSLYLSKSPEQKRKILKMIGSNFYYKDGKLTIRSQAI